jgi:microcystin-dependent protein
MAYEFVGEIRLFAGNYAIAGWAFCNGQLLPISENETLFTLIGTTYGGDGQSTFALPNLQGRIPLHQGNGFILAETGGVESVTLTTQQMPAHSHAFLGSTDVSTNPAPTDSVVATTATFDWFVDEAPTSLMNPNSLSAVGGNQPHNNFQPYTCINYIISLFGVFPNQT